MVARETIILHVEDVALLQRAAEVVLRQAGFDVVSASNGEDALKALETMDPHRCGLITDVDLGAGISGWELARRARKKWPTLPVVYVSGERRHEWPSEGVPNSLMVDKLLAPTGIVAAMSSLINSDGLRVETAPPV